MADLSGQSLGRYHILQLLGEGGMATVYKAFDTRLERDVAVKVIRREAFSAEVTDRMLQRFAREAKALSKLTHANIVPIIDYGDEGGTPYLVMPYISGGTLKDRLSSGGFDYQKAAHLLVPISRALEFAHTKGILHRDVKSSNILITEDGDPMLSDFGVAKILEEGEGATLTGTGVGLGTPEYMAPEQWLGKASPASDQYSLGVVFYEMVTGRKPFTADTPAAVLLKQASEPLPRPRTFVPGLPDEVEKVLFKVMARKPEDRYTNLLEFAAALERLQKAAPMPVKKPSKPVLKIEISPPIDRSVTADQYKTRDNIDGMVPQGKKTETEDARINWPEPSPRNTYKKILRPVLYLAGGAILLGLIFLVFWAAGGLKSHPLVTEIALPVTTPAITPTSTQQVSTILTTKIPSATPEPPTSTPAPGIGSTKVSTVDGMVMVYVPAGDFTMGSNVMKNEQPIHTVYLDAYWIDQTEVTNKMFAQCVSEGKCTYSHGIYGSYSRDSYYGDPQYDNFPVIYVSWSQAQIYCEWANRSLPTEAQWEKAARGVDERMYPWGNEPPSCDLANYSGCTGDTTAIGSYKLGKPYGVYDMAGNVSEWVADWYSAASYQGSAYRNPVDLVPQYSRGVRGGSFYTDVDFLRTTNRGRGDPTFNFIDYGFRCALPAN